MNGVVNQRRSAGRAPRNTPGRERPPQDDHSDRCELSDLVSVSLLRDRPELRKPSAPWPANALRPNTIGLSAPPL